MIVGCYVLHLYCDTCERVHYTPEGASSKHEFTGDSKQEAYRSARKRGWRISEQVQKAMCPECVLESTL